MKKKILSFILAFLMFVLVGSISPQKVNASIYGKRIPYTTQRALRGTWYYKDLNRSGSHYKIYRLRISAHRLNSCHLYKMHSRPIDKFEYWNQRKQKRALSVTKYWLVASTFRYKGQNMLNTRGWFQSAGDGTYYVPARIRADGRYVKAIRIAGGAYVKTTNWAVKSKKLAKRIPMPSAW